jgi:hypothetical protein
MAIFTTWKVLPIEFCNSYAYKELLFVFNILELYRFFLLACPSHSDHPVRLCADMDVIHGEKTSPYDGETRSLVGIGSRENWK